VQTRLAVLGHPVAHSLSPRLHAAAYGVLGLDWTYEAVDVTEEALPEFVAARDASWRGLSLTMPLKRAILPLLDSRDAVVNLAGGANTVLFDDASGSRAVRGFNTDVFGVREAFVAAGVDKLGTVHLLGGGATASSALVAAGQLGAKRSTISVRNPLKAIALAQLGRSLGMDVTVHALGDETAELPKGTPDAVISSLPGGAPVEESLFSERVRARAVLFDVAYDPWPSPLAQLWGPGATVISGIDMLLRQAVAQIRIFVAGDPDVELPDEESVLRAMRAAANR
jgi:shikimate dehydrogenase